MEDFKGELEKRGLGFIRRLDLDRLKLEAERDREYRVAFLRILGLVESRQDSDPAETTHLVSDLVHEEFERLGDNNQRLHGEEPGAE